MYLVTDETRPSNPRNTQSSWRRHGVIGALFTFVCGGWSQSRGPAKKRMRVIETLALGTKKQLLLVCCDGERFLVGTGPDQVQTIIRLRSEPETDDVAVPAVVGECV